MKKSKLIKIIIFSTILLISFASMTTLLIINAVNPQVSINSAEVTKVENNNTTDNVYYSIEIENNTNERLEIKYTFSVKMKCNNKIVSTDSHYATLYPKEIENFKYYVYVSKLNTQIYLEEGKDLTIDDVYITASLSIDTYRINEYMTSALCLIPVIIISGGLLLYTIFEKHEKQIQ